MQIFKMTGTIVIAAALIFSTAGCVKVKRKASFTHTDSPVIYHTFVTVDDWSGWAAEIAKRVEKAVKDRKDLDKKPIYMRPPNDRAFATGFYSLLHTELISRGLQVAGCGCRLPAPEDLFDERLIHGRLFKFPNGPVGRQYIQNIVHHFHSLLVAIMAISLDSANRGVPDTSAKNASILSPFRSNSSLNESSV